MSRGLTAVPGSEGLEGWWLDTLWLMPGDLGAAWAPVLWSWMQRAGRLAAPPHHCTDVHCWSSGALPDSGEAGAAERIQHRQLFRVALVGKTGSSGWKLKLGKHVLEMRHVFNSQGNQSTS